MIKENMRYWISSLTLLLFFIWILPLGFFFKPSQQASACGGQRAVCLCSHTDTKSVKSAKASGFGFQQNGTSANKEAASSSGGGGHYYLAFHQMTAKAALILEHRHDLLLSYRNPSLSATDHVPKA